MIFGTNNILITTNEWLQKESQFFELKILNLVSGKKRNTLITN